MKFKKLFANVFIPIVCMAGAVITGYCSGYDQCYKDVVSGADKHKVTREANAMKVNV